MPRKSGTSQMKHNLRRTLWLTLAMLGLTGLVPIHAQNASGTLVGQIKDPSGNAIVGATVTATNQATHDARTLRTDSSGGYAFPCCYRARMRSALVHQDSNRKPNQGSPSMLIKQFARTFL